MSKQTAIILITIIFLASFGALIWFYFSFNSGPDTVPPTPVSTEDFYDPFGTRATSTDNPDFTPGLDNNENNNDTLTNSTPLAKLRQITEEPIAGFSVVENTKTKKTDIRYILRGNGNIYETYTDSLEQKRLSITTIPKVYESTWLPDGQKLIIRYLKEGTETVETFSVKINPATTTLNEFEGGVDGNHLAENIKELAINPKGDKLFYLTKGIKGISGFIAKPDGLNSKLTFESPLTEWLVAWPKEETITLNTKPSALASGFLYFLNSTTGSLSKIIGNIIGLTTKTNKEITEVLYSDSSRITPKLYLHNIKTSENKLLPWNTLPEKCLWSNIDAKIIYCAVPKGFPPGNYPDIWYQGLVNFTDDLWLMNTETGAATLVLDIIKETDEALDLTNLQMDKGDNYLFFINKTDLTLWSLELK